MVIVQATDKQRQHLGSFHDLSIYDRSICQTISLLRIGRIVDKKLCQIINTRTLKVDLTFIQIIFLFKLYFIKSKLGKVDKQNASTERCLVSIKQQNLTFSTAHLYFISLIIDVKETRQSNAKVKHGSENERRIGVVKMGTTAQLLQISNQRCCRTVKIQAIQRI